MSPVTPPPAEPSRGDGVVPPPRRLVRRAREAVDVSRALMKRARRKGGAERSPEVAAAIDAASLARSAPALLWSVSRCSAGHGVTTSVVSAL